MLEVLLPNEQEEMKIIALKAKAYLFPTSKWLVLNCWMKEIKLFEMKQCRFHPACHKLVIVKLNYCNKVENRRHHIMPAIVLIKCRCKVLTDKSVHSYQNHNKGGQVETEHLEEFKYLALYIPSHPFHCQRPEII